MEKWDGKTDRRKNRPIELDVLISTTENIRACLAREFGDKDLVGNRIEGNVSRQLRELNEKVTIQNGRVGKLEYRNVSFDGGFKLAAILFSGTIALTSIGIAIFKAWH